MGIIAVDASALIAILAGEPQASQFMACAIANTLYISPINYVEACNIAASRLDIAELNMLMNVLSVTIHPTDAQQAAIARDAYRRFGKGAHPARLNLGDCFAYALANSLHVPLLYKGEDFAKTDIMRAA